METNVSENCTQERGHSGCFPPPEQKHCAPEMRHRRDQAQNIKHVQNHTQPTPRTPNRTCPTPTNPPPKKSQRLAKTDLYFKRFPLELKAIMVKSKISSWAAYSGFPFHL